MKNTILAALALALPSLSFAAQQPVPPQACAFGETTGDLNDHLELATGSSGKIWYKGEHLSLHRTERLGGLSRAERTMILMAANHDESRPEKETLEDFSSSDGYITYFVHNSLNREFAIVASYPGDNEFGAIIEIKKLRRNGEYEILNLAAVISDGDLENCLVSKDEVKELR